MCLFRISTVHWIHHTLTLIFTWYTFQFPQAQSRWGVFLNFIVHSFMYSYYALHAANVKIPRWISMSITAMQLLQMALGSYITCHVFYIFVVEGNTQWSTGGCDSDFRVAIFQMVMYVFYLYLFAEYFHNAYIAKKPKRA